MHLQIVVLSVLLNCVKALDLGSFYNYLRDDSSSSSVKCDEQKAAFLQGLKNGDSWAFKMLDAYGRPAQGITQGNVMDLGMFDQCLALQKNSTPSTSKIERRITGFIQRIGIVDQISASNFLLLAACVPDACYPSDLFGQLGSDASCQNKDETKKLDSSDIACLCFFSVIACLVIASTGYDVYLQKTLKGAKHPILLAFSFDTNGKKIFKTTQQPDQIECFNGLKVLSMFWIILGHRYSSFDLLLSNKEEALAWRRKWYAVYVLLAPLAVDTFLFISGALLAYVFLKTMRKPNQKFNIGLYYLHRYLRLTPALVVLYFFEVTLARRIQDGPMFPILIEHIEQTCLNKNWWVFFLYVQNYVTTKSMCLPHTWYLSVDMQLYIVSPLLLLPMLYYGKRMIYLVLPMLVLAAVTCTMLLFYFYEIASWSSDCHKLFYFLTHTRCSPWLIGLIFGAFLIDYQANKEKYQLKNKMIVLATWGVVVCVIGFLFFYQDDAEYNSTRIKSTFFFPLQRPVWALCLCWISFACLSGNGSFVNSLLSAPIFQILSKVTYSTYLVHYFIMFRNIAHMRTIPYFTDIDSVRAALGDICFSYLAGGIWTLAFESPVFVLEKVVFGKDGGRKRIHEANDGNNNENHRS